MPLSQVFLHPFLQIGALHASPISPSRPFTAVEHAEVEIASSKVPLQFVCDFEALFCRCRKRFARTNHASICAFVGFSGFVDIPEGYIATFTIDKAIRGINVMEVRISAIAYCLSFWLQHFFGYTEPWRREGVLSVIALSFCLVSTALLRGRFPAFVTVDVGYLVCSAVLCCVVGKELAGLFEAFPYFGISLFFLIGYSAQILELFEQLPVFRIFRNVHVVFRKVCTNEWREVCHCGNSSKSEEFHANCLRFVYDYKSSPNLSLNTLFQFLICRLILIWIKRYVYLLKIPQ